MIKYKRISISGLAGSGKSTVGKLLSEKLNYEFVSVGNYSRILAQDEYGMCINEFQELCRNNPKMDEKIDSYFTDYCQSISNLIIDYRLAFNFIDDCFHVYLNVSDDIAAKRIQQSDGRELELNYNIATLELIRTRNENMKIRFEKAYNVDFTNHKNYNLILNTDNQSPKEITQMILKNII